MYKLYFGKTSEQETLHFSIFNWLQLAMKGTFSKKEYFLFFGRDPSDFGILISRIFIHSFIIFYN